jgi:hypothetical protein
VYFDVQTEKGDVEHWQTELTTAQRLMQVGWTENTLKPGDSIVVTGAQSKDGRHSIWLQKILGPDGEALPLNEEYPLFEFTLRKVR